MVNVLDLNLKNKEIKEEAQGVRGIKFKIDTDFVVDADVINSEDQEILTVSEKGIGKEQQLKSID